MGIEDRDYLRERKLEYGAIERAAKIERPFNEYDSYGFTSMCPVCGKKSLVYSEEKRLYFCHNVECVAFGKNSADILKRTDDMERAQ